MSHVVVGLSGGVDSSTAAWLLKQKGYEVTGMTARVCIDPQAGWEEEEIAAARRVAEFLGIPHLIRDFREDFDREVATRFTEEYLSGRTPNPCIICNREIKWRALLACADEIGAEFVATGHYARIRQLENGRFAAAASATTQKDQTYVLFGLPQEAIARTLMPVGDYTKTEIRRIAEDAGIPSAHTPDSQDICFVSGNDYAAFLDRRVPERMPGEGDYLSADDGRKLGRHRGYVHYTIGQRKGLGIAAGHPLYVSAIRPETNEVVLSDTDVYGSELDCEDLRFMGIASDDLPVGVSRPAVGKVRYAHAGTPCVISRTEENRLHAVFSEPVRAITPGQAAVFYDQDGFILCGGWIS
ncbi:MAG: tRNA 2-thiouridine(34) synthase MnmA [Lachnospiraceae bacterium]|nr:tRNA 2-thiouridine(34) synthase MnmA [Lachnospiraceae bacterium]